MSFTTEKKSPQDLIAEAQQKISAAEKVHPCVAVTEPNWMAMISTQKAQIKLLQDIQNTLPTLTTEKELKAYMDERGQEVYPICAMTGEGLEVLLERLWDLLETYVEEPEEIAEEVVYKAQDKPDFEVKRADDGAFVITGPRIENLVAMTNFDDDQSLRRFQRIWRYMELDKLLKEKGIHDGNTVRICEMEFEYHE